MLYVPKQHIWLTSHMPVRNVKCNLSIFKHNDYKHDNRLKAHELNVHCLVDFIIFLTCMCANL